MPSNTRYTQMYTPIGFWLIVTFGIVVIFFSQVEMGSIAEVRYIIAGRSLANGYGLSIPGALEWAKNGTSLTFTHGPPLLAFWIAFTDGLNIPIQISIKLLNLSGFLGIAFLSYAITYKLTLQSDLAYVTSIMVLCLPSVRQAYFVTSTESPFNVFVLLQFYIAIWYFEAPKKSTLIIMSIIGALAFLTRYAGVPLIVSCGLLIWWTWASQRKFVHGIVDAVIYVILAGLPTMLFIGINYLSSGDIGNRSFTYHPMQIEDILSLVAITLTGNILIGILYFLSRRKSSHISHRFVQLLWFFIMLYPLFIGITGTFFDNATRVNGRILSPLYLAYPILIVLCVEIIRQFRSTIINLAVTSSIALLILFSLFYAIVDAPKSLFTFQPTESIQPFEFPTDIHIYTDRPEKIVLTFLQTPYAIPLVYNPFTGDENPHLEADITIMRNDLLQCKAVFIYYKSGREYLLTHDALLTALNTPLVEQPFGKHGIIYYWEACPVF